jgi:hypothetical protein
MTLNWAYGTRHFKKGFINPDEHVLHNGNKRHSSIECRLY